MFLVVCLLYKNVKKSGGKEKVRNLTSLLSITCWQFGQALVGLLFHLILSGSDMLDALLIFVAILLLSTNHDGLHKLHKIQAVKTISCS